MAESRRTNPQGASSGQGAATGVGSRTSATGATPGSSLAVGGGESGSSIAGRSPQSLRRLDPFTMMDRLGDEMERLFESFGFGRLMPNLARPMSAAAGMLPTGARGAAGRPDLPGFWSPQIEVYEESGDLVVCADLPGMRKEDVRLELDDDTLIIEGERRHGREDRGEGIYRTERSYGSFYRAIPLPDGTDPERVRASFRDGVLEVRAPMPQAPKRGRRIEIQGDSGARSGESAGRPGSSHLTQAGPPPLAAGGETGSTTSRGEKAEREAAGKPSGSGKSSAAHANPGKGSTGETEGLP